MNETDGNLSGEGMTREVTADGTVLAVRRLAGEGNPIVALHGFTGEGSTLIPLMEACRGGRPCVLIDLVGHGASDAPDYPEPYVMASVVDQVLSLIGPQEPGSVHLLGYSMGGRVALSMAARAPWYFASITSLSATPGILDPVDRAERYDADQALADRVEQSGVAALVDELLGLAMFEPYCTSLDSASMQATVEQRCRNTAGGLSNSLRGTGTGAMPPVWHMLPALRSPLLAIAGELDSKFLDIAKRMVQAAPFAQESTIAGAGHVVHVENCSAVSARVAAFLEVCESNADHPS
jgi:2-succinyl-6-hydroxy-2,4-cyclohexadiene-1-carboxylate synthase